MFAEIPPGENQDANGIVIPGSPPEDPLSALVQSEQQINHHGGSGSNPPPPTLTSKARAHLSNISTTFSNDLKQLSEIIARNSNAENVLVNHVLEAHSALKRTGLAKPQDWYLRSDFQVGLGTLLFGLAPTIASIAKDVLESGEQTISQQPFGMWIFMIGIPFAVAIVGAGLATAGWRRPD